MKRSPSTATAVTAAVAGRNTVNTPAIPAGTVFSPAYHSSRHSTLAVSPWNTSNPARPGAASAAMASTPASAKGSSSRALKACIQKLAVTTGTWPAMRLASST